MNKFLYEFLLIYIIKLCYQPILKTLKKIVLFFSFYDHYRFTIGTYVITDKISFCPVYFKYQWIKLSLIYTRTEAFPEVKIKQIFCS